MNFDIIKRMKKDGRDMIIFLKNNHIPIEITPSEYTTIHWDSFVLYLSNDEGGEGDKKNVTLLLDRSQIAGIQFKKSNRRETEKTDF